MGSALKKTFRPAFLISAGGEATDGGGAPSLPQGLDGRDFLKFRQIFFFLRPGLWWIPFN
jgi:hypothetical protein